MAIKIDGLKIIRPGGDGIRATGDPDADMKNVHIEDPGGHGINIISDPRLLAVELQADAANGITVEDARSKYREKLLAHGFDFDAALSRAGNLASVASLALAAFVGS